MKTNNALIKDEKTGYMYSIRHDSFKPEDKIKFLELFHKKPNVTACAHAVGADRKTIMNHLEQDPKFMQDYNNVIDHWSDHVEEKVLEYADNPRNFTDRIAWLRANRPEKWNQQAKLDVNVNTNLNALTDSLAKKALSQEYKKDAVDAEVVDAKHKEDTVDNSQEDSEKK